MSAFSAPSCLPQAAPTLRATSAAPRMVDASGVASCLSRRETLALGGVGAAWMLAPKGAWAAKKEAAKPSAPEVEDDEDEYAELPKGEGLKYAIIEEGSGAKAKIGDLVAIRFKAMYKETVIDDCFKTPNAYYYRVGSENVIRGLDLAVQNMRVGDRWALKVPSNLAFGDKGVKPSPGKPRIPGGATLDYEVFFEIYPGAEDDILEVDGEK